MDFLHVRVSFVLSTCVLRLLQDEEPAAAGRHDGSGEVEPVQQREVLSLSLKCSPAKKMNFWIFAHKPIILSWQVDRGRRQSARQGRDRDAEVRLPCPAMCSAC